MFTKDFNRVLEIVSRISEIEVKDIISKAKRVDIVDARGLFFKALTKLGYYPRQIAQKTKRTPEGVRYLINSFYYREKSNKILKKLSEEIEKEIQCN